MDFLLFSTMKAELLGRNITSFGSTGQVHKLPKFPPQTLGFKTSTIVLILNFLYLSRKISKVISYENLN